MCLCHFQLDLSDLQKELAKSESVFPENPSVWVKDLAGYLNYKLQAPRSDPMLSQHPHGQCCFPCPAAAGGLCSPELWGQSSVGSLELRGARRGVMGQPGAGGTMLGKMQPLTYPPTPSDPVELFRLEKTLRSIESSHLSQGAWCCVLRQVNSECRLEESLLKNQVF